MTTLAQRSFSGGELAPSLYARTDTSKYLTGLRTMRNFLLMRHGGGASRPGTSFVGEVSDSTKRVRLIEFVFNSDQTYVLEFGNLYMRVIRNGAQVTLTAQNITNISNAATAVLTYSGADTYANGDEVYISGVLGAMAPFVNNRNFKVANVNAGANTFELNYMNGTAVNSSAFGAYGSAGTIAEVYTISTPYVEADLQDLNFVQSADVITIVHPNYDPRELTRTAHTSWTLATITFAPSISAPTGVINSGAAGSVTEWVVTAVATETFEESLQSSSTGTSATPSSGSPITVSWNVVAGAQEYNVYKKLNGVYGFIGVAGGLTFVDTGYTPDTSDTPPITRNPFSGAGNFPSCVSLVQQRRLFANTDNNPETVYLSKSGQFTNFTISSPLQEDDAITFTMSGRQVNEVRNVIELGRPVVLTESGEWAVEGDASGVITPTAINLKQHGYNGSTSLRPLVVGGNALHVQARGAIVRDLGFDFQADGYRGNDLTIFSAHLFDGYELTDWAYQQIPHSIVWAVRSDGKLLGLTYIREQQLFGWHRHDMDGIIENVCVIPEDTEDALYLVVKRTINGATKRYIERMRSRRIDDILDFIGMDCALTYDGRHTGATTMTLSGGTTWEYTETLTLTASASTFVSTDVGNIIQLTGSNGTVIRFTITGYTSATVVTGTPHKTVPVAMRNVAITTWAKAVDEITGLWHLEGETVSVFGDGFVVASPNNAAYTEVTVSNGAVTLDRPYAVIHIGMPITCDIETLDVDTSQGESIADKKKNVSKVSLHVEASRGIWIGSQPPTDDDDDPLENLYELKVRESENYDDPVELATEVVEVNVKSQWNSNGRFFIRQVDPIPLSVLAAIPSGLFPFAGQGGG